MTVPINVKFKWTSPFEEKRPLSVPINQRTHIHGAEDLAPFSKAIILAPEDGTLYFFCAIRNSLDRQMKEVQKSSWPFDFKNHNYFYDLYGGIILLISKNRERTHIMTHSYRNQIFNQTNIKISLEESPKDERFPICVEHSFNNPKEVKEGDELCGVGNAGFSTGYHIHWEIHNGIEWNNFNDRIKPRLWLKEIF